MSNVIQKVKTATGYDKIYPMTPWIIQPTVVFPSIQADNTYVVNTVIPKEDLQEPYMLSFVADITNTDSCSIIINNNPVIPIKMNTSGNGFIPTQSGSITKNSTVTLNIYNGEATLVGSGNATTETIYISIPQGAVSIDVPGVYKFDTPIIDVDVEGVTTKEEYEALLSNWSLVGRIYTDDTTDGKLFVSYFGDIPEADIPIKIKVVR